MRTYHFRTSKAGTMPSQHAIEATDDTDFWQNKLPFWEARYGLKHVPNSVKCSVREEYAVAEPLTEIVCVVFPEREGKPWPVITPEHA